jgi:hypothetical protein
VGLYRVDRLLDQRFCDHHLVLIAARKFDDTGVAVQRLDVELVRPVGGERLRLALAGDDPTRLRTRNPSYIDVLRHRHGLKEAIALGCGR